MPYRNRTLKRHAREMRKMPTRAEDRLWSWLRGRRTFGFKFRRQVPAGPYILDFYCAHLRLAIELDGSQHDTPGMQEYDDRRSAFLGKRGVRVFRIPNELFIRDATMVEEQIAWVISEIIPTETLLPRRAGEKVPKADEGAGSRDE
jgi:very-short-patch-repair endonuclease